MDFTTFAEIALHLDLSQLLPNTEPMLHLFLPCVYLCCLEYNGKVGNTGTCSTYKLIS